MIKNIVGLGKTGRVFCEAFRKISVDYMNTRVIAHNIGKTKLQYPLEKQKNPEDYESNIPKLGNFFRGVKGEVLFIVNGAEPEASATLVILEQLQGRKIHILYVQPEKEYLGLTPTQQERMVFGVLQEMTRSGMFERIILVSEPTVEKVLGGLPILGRDEAIANTVTQTFHMIQTLKDMRAVSDTFSEIPVGARISTLGIIDFDNNLDRPFFELDFFSDKQYYYTFSDKVLESEKDLFGALKNEMKSRNKEAVKGRKTRVSFGIYATEFEQKLGYFLGHSSLVQTN